MKRMLPCPRSELSAIRTHGNRCARCPSPWAQLPGAMALTPCLIAGSEAPGRTAGTCRPNMLIHIKAAPPRCS